MFGLTTAAGISSAPLASLVMGIARGEGEEKGLLGTPYHSPTLVPEGIFKLGPLVITNSMLMSLLAVIMLSALVIWLSRGMRVIPGRKQNFLEAIIEALVDLVEQTAGRRTGRVILPLIGTLFIYILFANWLSLLPGVGTLLWHHSVPSVGLKEGGQTVPLLRAPNADLNMTLAMAVLTIVIVQVAGVVSNGAGGHFKAYLNPLHLIDELARVLSLSIRLFANVFGGEVLLTVMLALSFVAAIAVIPVVVPAIFVGLELFIGLIQALVFALLSLVYITLAVAGHGHADAETAEEHAEAAAH